MRKALRPTYLLIADAFHPETIPPEASTNTFLAGALTGRGWDVAVWAGAGSAVPPDACNMRLVRTASYWGLGEILRILLWILFNRPARVGLAYFADMYSRRGHITLVPLAARMMGIPCTTLFTNNERPNGRLFLLKYLPWLGRRKGVPLPLGLLEFSTTLLFYSHLDRVRLMETAPPELWTRTVLCNPPAVLPSPGNFDAGACRNALGAAPEDFLIGHFGMIYRGKSVETLVSAVQILCSRGIDVKLALIGATELATAGIQLQKSHRKYQDRLRDFIHEAGIGDRITWTGYVAPLQAARHIASCDLICLPFREGLTSTRSSFIECARLGVSVVTTRSDVTDEFLCRDDSGIAFVSPRNPVELAEAILRLRNDPDERARRGGLLKRFAEAFCGSRALVDSFDGRGVQSAADARPGS